MLENDQLHNMMIEQKTKNILWKFYEKTRFRPEHVRERELIKKDRCLLARSASMFQLLRSPVFFVSERKAAELFMSVSFLGDAFFRKIWLTKVRFDFEIVFPF